jgi:hypothetical protein
MYLLSLIRFPLRMVHYLHSMQFYSLLPYMQLHGINLLMLKAKCFSDDSFS